MTSPVCLPARGRGGVAEDAGLKRLGAARRQTYRERGAAVAEGCRHLPAKQDRGRRVCGGGRRGEQLEAKGAGC